MNYKDTINVLLCLDDLKWDYTRHAAVTILSLLETNKMNKIKIFILSAILPKECIEELKRIVKLYNQEIEFIINDNIVPEELKWVIINKNNLTRWVWYRRFFPKVIKDIDRILSIDCDVLIMWDISRIYNMDMHWKAISWYYDMLPYRCKWEIFWTKNYINAWVLLFDAKKYDMKKIDVKSMEEINKKYSEFFHWSDQDKINIIFKDDIYVWEEEMDYLITNKYFTRWLKNAKIVHCLNKPYIQYSSIPKKLVKLYYKYLDMTKWKWYEQKKYPYSYFRHIKDCINIFIFNLLLQILWDKRMYNLVLYKRRKQWYKTIKN